MPHADPPLAETSRTVTTGERVEALVAQVRADLAVRLAQVPLEEVKARALAGDSPKDGARALRGEGVAVIAEVRQSASSKGALAEEYEQAGANVVSVPIEASQVLGGLQDLRDVRAQVDVPVLCRDLVVSSYQLWEARAHGADLVQLSAAVLEQDALVSLIERAESIGLSALVEVRNAPEVLRAVGAGAGIIVVNTCDPHLREVDRDALARLVALIPERIVRVAECGVADRLDLIACARAGADAVLVGQSLVGGVNARQTVAGLVATGAHPALWHGRRQAA